MHSVLVLSCICMSSTVTQTLKLEEIYAYKSNFAKVSFSYYYIGIIIITHLLIDRSINTYLKYQQFIMCWMMTAHFFQS